MTYFSEILTKILHVPGIGSRTAYKFVSHFKNEPLFNDEELVSKLIDLTGKLKLNKLSEIIIRDAFYKGESAIEESSKMGVKTITIFDNDYPDDLRSLTNPPILLNYLGNLSIVKNRPTCAVIGTREPTPHGFNMGVRIGELLGESEVVVVSGLAKGCDTAGHTGCLNKNGITIAVLAHGLKHIYPKENKRLAEKILETGGALVTEYFYSQTPRNNFFVERDRIQAGLSGCLFIIETGVKGGTMHTVQYAKECSRKVFVYKHPEKYWNEDKTKGNQKLIAEGQAIPVGSSGDFNNALIDICNTKNSRNYFANTISENDFTVANEPAVQYTVVSVDEKIRKGYSKRKKTKTINQIIRENTRSKSERDDQSESKDSQSQLGLWE